MFVVAPTTSSSFPYESGYVVGDGNNAAATTALGVGVIPLLGTTATDSEMMIGRSRAETACWQQNQGLQLSKNEAEMMTATCQDCGNQSKKDCSHQRCRTCCRSRGFDCVTHVKSTWIPAARRRERHTAGNGGGGGGGDGGGGGASSGSTSEAKKPRLICSQTTSNNSTCNTPPPCFDSSSSRQDAGFKETLPGQVRAPAVFKCVKVTAIEDEEDEFAYQAIVKIGGHLFKGFLYDQGVVQKEGFTSLSDLQLGGNGGRNVAFQSSPHPYHHSDVYSTPGGGGGGGGLLGGSNYGNTIN